MSAAEIAILVLERRVASIRDVPPECDEGKLPEWECYAYASDFNSEVEACRALLDAIKAVYDEWRAKGGAPSPSVEGCLAEAEERLGAIELAASGSTVRSEERNRLVWALNALVRALEELERAVA